MKKLAVIMPRFANDQTTHELTDKCIEAVLKNTDKRFDISLTVVDDGSKIGKSPDNRLKYIFNGQNKGIAVRWNQGWQVNQDADFLCWLNADCEVTPNWAYPLIVVAEQMGVIAMPYTNGVKDWKVGFTGWCFLTTQDIANKIGPFDETFVPAQYEDTDWFHRAIYYHKIPIVNVPSSNVLHNRKHGGTQFIQRFEWLHLANRYRYAWKHNVNPEAPPPMYRSPLPDVDIEEDTSPGEVQ